MQRLLRIILMAIVIPVATVVVGIPMLILAGLSIPVGIVHNYRIRRRERRVLERLRSAGRFLAWAQVAERLGRGEGTLIVEQANKDGARFWWTPDDVLALAPASPPTFDDLDYVFPNPAHPFVGWCLANYTSPSRGSAFITTPSEISLPRGFVEVEHLTTRFPGARVVTSVLVSRAG